MKHALTFFNGISLPERILWFLAFLCLGIGIWARFWHLDTIVTPIFDEVYFPVFAANFLRHGISFDVHPPLGKVLLSLGIAAFGDNSLGWRIIPALFGVLNIALFGALARQIGLGRIGFLSVIALTALDGLLIVYSRVGLIDGLLLASILFTFYVAWLPPTRWTLFWLFTLIGLTVSIKWVGLGVVVPVGYLLLIRRKLVPLSLLWSYFVYEAVVTLGQVIGRVANPLKAGFTWNGLAAAYHLHLTATHPYASSWWSWPLELRPVLFYYQTVPGGTSVIASLSNPLLWGAVDLAVIGSLLYLGIHYFRKTPLPLEHPLYPLLLGYFAFWLPWAMVHRVLFLYHYIPSYAFGLLLLSYWLNRLWKQNPWETLLAITVLSSGGVYFLPLAIGTPLSDLWLARHIWYKPWIY